MTRPQRVAVCWAVVVLTSHLSGCIADYYGFAAVGRLDGKLTFAVVVCKSELHEVSVTTSDPDGAPPKLGVPTDRLRGVWTPREGGQGVHTLDVKDPGADWETVQVLESIAGVPGTLVVEARGNTSGNFTPVTFDMQDFAELGEDEWIYGRTTTTDLSATATKQCQ